MCEKKGEDTKFSELLRIIVTVLNLFFFCAVLEKLQKHLVTWVLADKQILELINWQGQIVILCK